MTTPDTTTDPAVDEPDPVTEPDPDPVAATPEELLEQLRKKDQENVKLKKNKRDNDKELERLRAIEETTKSESEKAIEAAKTEGRTEAEAEYKSRLLAERIMRRATGVLADPSDVVLIDFSTIDDADDEAQIDAAIEALLEAKPHLAATEGDGLLPAPTTVLQGPRGKVTQTKLTQGQQAEKWLRNQLGG